MNTDTQSSQGDADTLSALAIEAAEILLAAVRRWRESAIVDAHAAGVTDALEFIAKVAEMPDEYADLRSTWTRETVCQIATRAAAVARLLHLPKGAAVESIARDYTKLAAQLARLDTIPHQKVTHIADELDKAQHNLAVCNGTCYTISVIKAKHAADTAARLAAEAAHFVANLAAEMAPDADYFRKISQEYGERAATLDKLTPTTKTQKGA